MDRKLIVGLGNPGSRYSKTRHNLGFMVADKLKERFGFPPWKKQNRSRVTSGVYPGYQLYLAKPQTYMNLSGNAVLSLMTKYRLKRHEILVVLDDLALPFGTIRFRQRGSDGGHNGLAHIIEKLGSREIERLRIGIDQPPLEIDPADYVLTGFTTEQRLKLPEIINTCADGIETLLNKGIVEAMNNYNRSC